MAASDALDAARAHFARGEWNATLEAIAQADGAGLLEADDHELRAHAAYMLGQVPSSVAQ